MLSPSSESQFINPIFRTSTFEILFILNPNPLNVASLPIPSKVIPALNLLPPSTKMSPFSNTAGSVIFPINLIYV